MRTNLIVPFNDRFLAKAAGAYWDAGRRVWYVVNCENLTPFLRWMPAHLLAPAKPIDDGPRPVAPQAKGREGNGRVERPRGTKKKRAIARQQRAVVEQRRAAEKAKPGIVATKSRSAGNERADRLANEGRASVFK